MSVKLNAPLAAALLVLALSNAVAQAPVQAQQDPLGLTPTEKTKIIAINTAAGKQLEIIKHNPSLSDDAKMAQTAALLTNMESQQRGVLSPAQKQTYDFLQAKNNPYKLTILQKLKLRKLVTDTGRKTQGIILNTNTSIDARAQQVLAAINASKKARSAFLSPQQAAMLTAAEDREVSSDPLHRTALQMTKMQIITFTANSQAQQIIHNAALTQQQKGAKLVKLQAQVDQQTLATLTPAQVAMQKKLASVSGAPRR